MTFSEPSGLTLFFFETYTAPKPPQVFMRIRSPFRSAHLLVLLLALAGVLAPRVFAAAQAGAREHTMYVSAVDSKGEPVEGLGPDAFVVQEDGRRREILHVSRAADPIDLALLVDNSAAAQSAMIDLRTALSNFVAKMAAGNQIAVIGLADRPTIITDYTNDPKKLSDAVKLFAMPSSGMTLLDALMETSKGLEKREAPRAVIVAVITDGTEFTNFYSKDVVREMVEAGAQLHLVGIGRFLHSEEHSIRERSFLLTEATATGGDTTTILASTGLDSTLQRLARELSSQYKVVYSRPESLIPPEKIEVSSARADVTMRGSLARGESRDIK
jgi:VWFA-related protein